MSIRFLSAPLLLIIIFVVLSACRQDAGDPTTGSESHFLEICQDSADCPSGLQCLCGICTLECVDDTACGPLGTSICVPTVEIGASCSAAGVPEAAICAASCTDDDHCIALSPFLTCAPGGWCEPRTPSSPPEDDVRTDCGEGHFYQINGEPYCVYERPGDPAQDVPCPPGMFAHRYMEILWDEESYGELSICSLHEALTAEATTIIEELTVPYARHSEQSCDDVLLSSYCGACLCQSCTDNTCEHTRCDVTRCATGDVCEDRQCVPDPLRDGLTCDNVYASYQELLANNSDCETSADCTLVGGSGSYCDCSYLLGSRMGDSINVRAAAAARAHYDLFDTPECDDVRRAIGCTYDVGPSFNPRCENNRCTATEDSCFDFED